ncbi:hypothetical protein [Ahniella affigens]|uniref:hypothetical protein n=1 Tax=Ahniella affigens TaxID=2021234 RepID=UPI0011B247FE|nr:hypothetical protein [Ahniella affigens]
MSKAENPRPFFRPAVPPSEPGRWSPLPSLNAPLAALYPILKARADQGDAPAACRLSAELHWCTRVQEAIDFEVSANRIKVQKRLDPDGHCSGVSASHRRQAIGYARQAALAGSLSAIEAYVGGDLMSADIEAAADYVAEYADEAPRLAEAGLQAGSRRILDRYMMATADSGGLDWFSRAVGSNLRPSRRAMIWLLAMRVSPETAPELMVPGDPNPAIRKVGFIFDLPIDSVQALNVVVADWQQMWFSEAGRAHSGQAEGTRSFAARPENEPRPDFNRDCSERYIEAPLSRPAIVWPEVRTL